ncbi:hypothetical protein VXF16_004683 [Pseudomonas aeruginosa]|uniref:hypothetical protein n=1 Tax=Pseudomonas aeruginosa TaxID=287 RepID=UPI000A699AFA|nr:hypothetical protein [Pseudomonas aeruginosa]ELJ2661420.1 hypothetical protein [Pseudomonas aeruginosa]ELK4802109.1 hypothetical protein [Pseudomonas aeruginosa]ELK4832009.1 hypothetical protein [Pseudomonas aeruginosa]EMD9534585.1 hypothetical protein [Pseudomonas aeruginosa]MBG4528651.1 hypothetical protein [Pseudomonas aeruginosa]
MPTQCANFAHLEARLTDLRVKFLDAQITAETNDPTTFSPDLDSIAAFRLLIHAEIEDFLERKAKENLDRIELQLVKSATGSSRIFPELFYIAAVTNRPLDAVLAFDVGALKGHISGIIGTARGIIKENNGIKEGSFNTLSVFAGKTADEVDSTLSASLNSYGKSRGDVAHQSTRHSSTINAPSAEFASAKDLVEGLALYFDLTS